MCLQAHVQGIKSNLYFYLYHGTLLQKQSGYQVKSVPFSKNAAHGSKSRAALFQNGFRSTPKRRPLRLPTVIMVGMFRKEAVVDGISNKEAVVDDSPVYNEENFEGEVREQSGSEVTVMEIDDL